MSQAKLNPVLFDARGVDWWRASSRAIKMQHRRSYRRRKTRARRVVIRLLLKHLTHRQTPADTTKLLQILKTGSVEWRGNMFLEALRSFNGSRQVTYFRIVTGKRDELGIDGHRSQMDRD